VIEFRRKRQLTSNFTEGLEVAEIQVAFCGPVQSDSGMVINLKSVDHFMSAVFAAEKVIDFGAAQKVLKFYKHLETEFINQFGGSGVSVSSLEIIQPRKNVTYQCSKAKDSIEPICGTQFTKMIYFDTASVWSEVQLLFSSLIIPFDSKSIPEKITSLSDLEKIKGLVRFSVKAIGVENRLISYSTNYS
jgi:hypothetical protein